MSKAKNTKMEDHEDVFGEEVPQELDIAGTHAPNQLDGAEAGTSHQHTPDLDPKSETEDEAQDLKKKGKKKAAEKAPESPVSESHSVYEQVQLYRNGNKIEEGRVIKRVCIEADRAERMNSQKFNTLIFYRRVNS